jgi:hypothetical protein
MHEAVPAAPEAELADLLGGTLAAKVVQTLEDRGRLAERDVHNLEVLRKTIGRKPAIVVPELAGDVHDLAGLAAMQPYLFNG